MEQLYLELPKKSLPGELYWENEVACSICAPAWKAAMRIPEPGRGYHLSLRGVPFRRSEHGARGNQHRSEVWRKLHGLPRFGSGL